MKPWLPVLLSAAMLAGCSGVAPREMGSQTLPPPRSGTGPPRAGEVVVTGSDVELSGFLYRPATPGAHPAILLLHGCGGFRNAVGVPNESYRFWAEHWRRLGFVVLLLDSFTPRGEKETCTQNGKRIRAHVERVSDAYAGLEHLARLADVDASRIFLQGWSNGGTTTLQALTPEAPGRRSDGPRFKAAVAYYPGCLRFVRAPWVPTAPLLIQSGAADDWTPVRYCEQMVDRAPAGAFPVELDVYAGAHHSFDRLHQPLRLRPGVGAGGKGAHVGTNLEAREKSLRRTTQWLLSQAK